MVDARAARGCSCTSRRMRSSGCTSRRRHFRYYAWFRDDSNGLSLHDPVSHENLLVCLRSNSVMKFLNSLAMGLVSTSTLPRGSVFGILRTGTDV